ncbi:unnamed protein product [Timema podura]|uniref:C2 PI3K-type domain-containing protein n=1 Tax=Timema podura TaxID=61482 RepID=A0ABN7PAL6_TIMPD|nr:unnamed protein product [Timema podura]
MLDLRVWPNKEADGNFPSSTHGKARDHGKEQMQRLAKLSKKHRNGHLAKVDWLDRLTFREIEMINEKEKRNSEYMYLMVEFPTIEMDGTLVSVASDHSATLSEQLVELQLSFTSLIAPIDWIVLGEKHAVVFYEQDGDEVYQFRVNADIVTVPDHEILQVNQVK